MKYELLKLAYIKHKKDEIHFDKAVATPTPITPRLNFITIIKSRNTLIIHDIIKKIRGVFESPKALNIEDNILKNDVGINPIKIVLK